MSKAILRRVKRALGISLQTPRTQYAEQVHSVPIAPQSILLETHDANPLGGYVGDLVNVLRHDERFTGWQLYIAAKRANIDVLSSALPRWAAISYVACGSSEYYSALSQCALLVNDASFPWRFVKKQGQKYVNLRFLRAAEDEPLAPYFSGTTIRDCLAADYLLFPNPNVSNYFLSGLRLTQIYCGSVVTVGNNCGDCDCSDALTRCLLTFLADVITERAETQNEARHTDGSEIVLFVADGIEPACVRDYILNYRSKDSSLGGARYCVSYPQNDEYATEMVKAFEGTSIACLSYRGKRLLTSFEEDIHRRYRAAKIGISDEMKGLDAAFKREWRRRYGDLKVDRVVYLGAYKQFDALLVSANVENACFDIPAVYDFGLAAPHPGEAEEGYLRQKSSEFSISSDVDKTGLVYSSTIRGGLYALILPRFLVSDDKMTIRAFMRLRTTHHVSLGDFRVSLGEKEYAPCLSVLGSNVSEIKPGAYLCRFELSVPADDFHSMAIHNYARAYFSVNGHQVMKKAIRYSWLRPGYHALRSGFHVDEQSGITAFFRQTAKGNLVLTVRNHNTTDSPKSQAKLKLAWAISKIPNPSKKPILLYEKNSAKYEESARIVYEHLRDLGRDDVFFIASRECIDGLTGISDSYLSHMIQAHSLAHYVAFFRANVFIGTETMGHAIELRVEERRAKEKLRSKGNTFVFLQHGVMYMVSLDSPQRTSFRKSEQPCQMYIVCNSENEKKHFVEYGGFDDGDLLECGLPKFDRAYADDDADLIVIMPTWRPWEFNAFTDDPSSTRYWKMIEEIREAIPDQYKEKVVVQAHPLFNRAGDGTIRQSRNIDELLRRTRVLITDYSSVAYDAFYRGCNVIYYWADKDECMERYGAPTHLMIDDDTAPGYICYTPEDVSLTIDKAYQNPQPTDQVERYRHIVKFHDGHNTERLIELLKERGVLE